MHSGRFGPAERAELQRWLAESEIHQAAFDEVRAAWNELPYPRTELASARHFRRRLPSGWLAGSLAAALLLAVGALEGWPPWADLELRTGKGENREIRLSDGSRVELGADSAVAVHYRWNRRSVELLRGEALFELGKSSFRPFEVLSGGARIRDIGTRFDVAMTPRETRLTVLEGAVLLTLAGDAMERKIGSGQTASFGDRRIFAEPQPADIAAATAWRSGELVFRARPLADALDELARYHPVEFRVLDPAVSRLKLSGRFSARDLPLFLATLESTLPVKSRRNGPVVTVSAAR